MLLKKLRELISLYKNRDKINNALEFYTHKEEYERAHEYYIKGAFNMNAILNTEQSPYQYHERLAFLKKFKESREEAIKVLKDYHKSIAKGASAVNAIKHKEASDLSSIMMAIKISNPLYDITEISEGDNHIKFTIDSSLSPTDMAEIFDTIYRSVSAYHFEYTTERSYSLNRIVYKVDVDQSYLHFANMLKRINAEIASKIPSMIDNAEPEARKIFIEYIDEFYSILSIFDDINNMVSIVKADIMEIVESNKGLCAIISAEKEDNK